MLKQAFRDAQLIRQPIAKRVIGVKLDSLELCGNPQLVENSTILNQHTLEDPSSNR